jgi:hypothetical protein
MLADVSSAASKPDLEYGWYLAFGIQKIPPTPKQRCVLIVRNSKSLSQIKFPTVLFISLRKK